MADDTPVPIAQFESDPGDAWDGTTHVNDSGEQAGVLERMRWWGVEFAPIPYPVMVDGRQVPCLFKILDDQDEENLTRYMLTVPLELPKMPDPQPGLEAVWQAVFAQEVEKLRAQAELRALVASFLLKIDGRDFRMDWADKIKEIATWPPRLNQQLAHIYGSVVSRAPIVGLEQLEREKGFANALSVPGASAGSADSLAN